MRLLPLPNVCRRLVGHLTAEVGTRADRDEQAQRLQQLRDESSARELELSRTLGELHRKLDSVLDAPR